MTAAGGRRLEADEAGVRDDDREDGVLKAGASGGSAAEIDHRTSW